MDITPMRETNQILSIVLPARLQGKRRDEICYTLSCLSDRMGVACTFVGEGEGYSLCIDGKELHIPFTPVAGSCFPAETTTGQTLWCGERGVHHEQKTENLFSLNCDVISPVADLLTLREEFNDQHRDLYGGVEGRRSIRYSIGDGTALLTPWFDHLALYLCRLLELASCMTKHAFSVAVTCDVDYVDDKGFLPVLEWLKQRNVERPGFYLFGGGENGKTRYDPSYDISTQATQERLLSLLDTDVEIGMHCGFLAHDNPVLLKEQKDRLEQWSGRELKGHRSHYLRFAYPRSWRWQQQVGFSYDSSLGYPDISGIRNAACALNRIPHRAEEKLEPFAILPCMVMDQHFFWPQPMSIEQRSAMIDRLLAEIETVSGTLVLDFHPYTFHTPGYEGWWDPLDEFLQKAVSKGARIGGIQVLLDDIFPASDH
jgi:hypothetical protein